MFVGFLSCSLASDPYGAVKQPRRVGQLKHRILNLAIVSLLLSVELREWRGLAVSVEDCHSKGRGFEFPC